ncbi:T6SS effector amidase Tae4 family protein [Massilia sp. W12]|uniref:T6SS effector amidase Tae4 family protein n=1 Tax=Massilia sp. W12 TaxID=3126507 RepID=UPI0030CDBB8C
MKISYKELKKHHSSSEISDPSFKDSATLYEDIGYSLDALVTQNPGYENTCAVRMSLALLASGLKFKGRLMIKSGLYKGRMIEPGAKLLADQLSKNLAKPLIFQDARNAQIQLAGKQGVIFFDRIVGYGGGHIDLIEASKSSLVCHSHCYFNCKQVWFWALS